MQKSIQRIIKYFKVIGLKGFVLSIASKLLNKELRIKIVGRDHRHPISLRLLSSDIPAYRQVFLDKEYDFSSIVTPEVIIDAGANIGMSSIYFANKYPNAKIIALEPENSNFDLLEENTLPYKNIKSLKSALWSSCGYMSLVDPGLGNWGFMTKDRNTSNIDQAKLCDTVISLTVNQIMQDQQIDKIDILKIDIEGAEKEVFSNTSLWLDKVDMIIIELHEHLKPGCNRSFYLGSNGFDCEWTQGENIFLSRESEDKQK